MLPIANSREAPAFNVLYEVLRIAGVSWPAVQLMLPIANSREAPAFKVLSSSVPVHGRDSPELARR
jgi:hypothetical protein